MRTLTQIVVRPLRVNNQRVNIGITPSWLRNYVATGIEVQSSVSNSSDSEFKQNYPETFCRMTVFKMARWGLTKGQKRTKGVKFQKSIFNTDCEEQAYTIFKRPFYLGLHERIIHCAIMTSYLCRSSIICIKSLRTVTGAGTGKSVVRRCNPDGRFDSCSRERLVAGIKAVFGPSSRVNLLW